MVMTDDVPSENNHLEWIGMMDGILPVQLQSTKQRRLGRSGGARKMGNQDPPNPHKLDTASVCYLISPPVSFDYESMSPQTQENYLLLGRSRTTLCESLKMVLRRRSLDPLRTSMPNWKRNRWWRRSSPHRPSVYCRDCRANWRFPGSFPLDLTIQLFTCDFLLRHRSGHIFLHKDTDFEPMQEDLDTHIFEFHFLSKSIESPNWTSLTCISYASSISTAKKNISQRWKMPGMQRRHDLSRFLFLLNFALCRLGTFPRKNFLWFDNGEDLINNINSIVFLTSIHNIYYIVYIYYIIYIHV